MEDRWEKFSNNYNRHSDELKAPVRERILEITEERLEWIQFLNSVDINTKLLPEADMKKLAELSLRLNAMLNMLNSESYSVAESESEELLEAIEKMSENQSELIAKMSSFMNVKNIQE